MAAKEEQRSKKRREIQTLRRSLEELYQEKETLSANFEKARADMNREHDEMRRIQSELLYKDKSMYEDMIRRLENDMQFNSKKYSAHEESRILNDIAHHKRGMVLLEQFERKKNLYEELRESTSTKKHELDSAVNRIMDLKRQQLPTCHETIVTLTREIDALKNEITDLTNQKLDYKKQIEDHIKENLVKQQQAKKAIREQHQMEKTKVKADEVMADMENVQKDYNKLIGYFQKLAASGSMESVSSCTENASKLSASRTPSLAQSQPLNVSASSPSFSQSFNQSSASSSTSSLLSLSLSASNTNELSNEISNSPSSPCQSKLSACKSSDSSQFKLAPPNTLGINFQLQTSNLGESSVYTFKSPIDEFGGCFVMKQKIDEETTNRKRNWKKSKQKSFKISHPMEVINLLIKMNIPIHLSSQYDECLKLLHERREVVSRQLDIYRAQKLVDMKTPVSSPSTSSGQQGAASAASSSLHSKEPDNKHSDTSMQVKDLCEALENLNTNLYSDNNSEKSSCPDSNYDSDTSFHHKNSASNENGNFDAKLLESFLSRQSTITNALNNVHGAEDLHAITDHLLKEQMKVNELLETENGDSEVSQRKTGASSRSSSPNTPTNNHQQAEETVAFTPPSSIAVRDGGEEQASQESTEGGKSESLKLNVKDSKTLAQSLLRQMSDGYSSSCSPLSASSINNEQPSVNPFFHDVNSASSNTVSSSSATNDSSDDLATPPILKINHPSLDNGKGDLKKGHSTDEPPIQAPVASYS